MRRKLGDFLADSGHWAGYTADPAETAVPCAWLRLGKLEVYVSWGPR